jgi:hypothetical protein
MASHMIGHAAAAACCSRSSIFKIGLVAMLFCVLGCGASNSARKTAGGTKNEPDPLAPDVGPPPGPGALAAAKPEASRPTMKELVRQSFAQWKPEKTLGDKSSPGRMALDWVEQPNRELEFVPVGEKWTFRTPVTMLAISPDGQFLLAGGVNGQCRVWSLKTGQQTGFLTEKLPGSMTIGAISPDGKLAAVGCGPAGLAIWETATGKIVSQHPTGELLAVSFSSDSRRVSAIDKTQWHDVEAITGAKANSRALPQPIIMASLSPSQRQAIVFSREGGRQLKVLTRGDGDSASVTATDCGTLPVGPYALAMSDHGWAAANEEFIRVQRPTSSGSVLQGDLVPKINHPHKLFLVADGKWLVSANSGQLEIWNTEELAANSRVTSQRGSGPLVVFSADGQTIAEAFSDSLSVWQVKNWPEPSNSRLTQLISESFRQENYDLLEDLLQQVADDPKCFPWATNISKAGYLIEQFLNPQLSDEDAGTRRQALARWHQKRPGSVAAQLAMVWQLVEDAWAARGSGFANTVSPAQWIEFHRLLAEARKLLMPLMENKNVPLEAYFQLLVIAKGEQWEEEQVVPFVDQLLEREPEYFRAHIARVEMLMPRWGGGVPDSEAYARRVADKVGGESGDMLYARMASGLQCYYGAKTFFEQTQFDPERVFRGLELLGGQTPPNWAAANVGLLFAAVRADHEQAQRFGMILMQAKGYDVWNPRCFKDEKNFEKVMVWAVNPLPAKAPPVLQAPIPAVGGK